MAVDHLVVHGDEDEVAETGGLVAGDDVGRDDSRGLDLPAGKASIE